MVAVGDSEVVSKVWIPSDGVLPEAIDGAGEAIASAETAVAGLEVSVFEDVCFCCIDSNAAHYEQCCKDHG